MKNPTKVFLYIFILILNVCNLYSEDKKHSNRVTNTSIESVNVLTNDVSTLPKNQIIPLVNDGANFTSLSVDGSENCLFSVCSDDWTADGASAIDSNLTNFTTSSILLADIDVLSITYPTEDIPAGAFAGFRIQSSSLLGLLGNITIRTRDNSGNLVETYSPTSNLLSNTLDFSAPINIGFVTTGNFRTIEIVVSGLVSVATLDVYYPFIKLYQENPTTLPCNEITSITNPLYPIEIDDVGVTGVNVSLIGDVIENADFIIDSDENNSATLNAGLAGIGVLATSFISVKKQKDYSSGITTPFTANTYAGFNITSANLLTLNVIGNITISTYLNNVFREDNTANNALINVPLLNAFSQNVGFVTTMNYDEIRITVSQPIGVNLGEINVNYPVIKSYCVNTTLNCNEQIAWVNTEHPTEISIANNSGLLAVGGSVDNLNNIINTDTTDFAEIDLNVGAISSLEIGVYDVLQEYTEPHFVGFEIETTSLLEVDLLNNISLSTYLNGAATGDSVNGTNILLSTPLLTGANKQNIGFVTTNTFDEVRIQFNTTVGVNLGIIKIYNSTVQKMCKTTMECIKTYYLNSPEFSTYVDFSQTGVGGVACVGCEVSGTDAVISDSNVDFAEFNITAGALATASLAVRDATNKYPANSFAGFVVKSNSSAIKVSLFESLIIETLDQNGNVLESANGTDLLDVTLLIDLIGGSPSGLYNVGFKPTQNYYGIKITARKLIDVNTTFNLLDNNDLHIYGAFVDTRGALGPGFETCADADEDLITDLNDLDSDSDGIIDSIECGSGVIDFSTLNFTNQSVTLDNGQSIVVSGAITQVASSNAGGDSDGNLRLSDGDLLLPNPPDYSQGDSYSLTINSPAIIKISNLTNAISNFDSSLTGGDEWRVTSAAGFIVSDPDNQLLIQDSGTDFIEFRPALNQNITAGTGTWTITTIKPTNLITLQGSGNADSAVNVIVSCADTDNDGVPNYLDLDSDNDGCPDAVEAAVPSFLISSGVDLADGILDNTDNAIIDTTKDFVGENGFANSLEDVDTVNTNIINEYTTSNYNMYALNNAKNGCGIPMITQVYWKGSEKIIEVTNRASSNVIVPNAINLNLFNNGVSNLTATVSNPSEITSGNSILYSSGAIAAQTKSGVSIITDTNITNFDATDDIIAISRSGLLGSTLPWESRIDVVQSLTDNTSFVRIDDVLQPNDTYVSSEWVPFIDNSISTIFNNFLRHPQAPLLSEISSGVNTNANALLGLHNFGPTILTSNTWGNGFPDRSRYTIVNDNYLHQNSRLSARKLEVQGANILSIENQLLVVTNNLNIADTAEIRLVGTSQLVQTHTGSANVTGNGKIYIEQNSDLESIYRYNYMSSPVTTLSTNTYTVASVLKDGTNALSHTGAVGQGATNIARNINFVAGYNGSTATPINIAEYWIYTFASANGIRASWAQKGKDGLIPITDGFIFKGPGVTQNYTFVGNPNDGEYSTTVGSNESYLLGNPFPSALNGLKFIQDNINSIDGTLYFWDHVGEENVEAANDGHSYAGYVGGYATVNLSMGISAVGKVDSKAFSITLESEEATTNGTQTVDNGVNGVTLDEGSEYLEFKSLPKATDAFKIIYKASTSKTLILKINNSVISTYTLEPSTTYREFVITKCLEVGVDIRLESIDNTLILIDNIIVYDADGEISCAPGTGTNGSLYKTPGTYIPVGQGFFVGGDSTGGNIVFNNSQREFKIEAPGSSVFFKNEQKINQNSTSANNSQKLKLNMEYLNSEDGQSYQRQIGLSFNNNNTLGFDKGYDSEVFDLGETDMYWKFQNDNRKYVIAGVPNITDDLEIPIEIVLNYDGTIALNATEITIERNVYLKDNVTNKLHSLFNNTIALQLQKGTYTNRFSLVFNNSVLSIEDDYKKTIDNDISVIVNNTSDELIIKNHHNLEIEKVEIFNILGQKIQEWNNIDNIFETKLNIKNLNNQVYVVNIQNENGHFSKKIIIE